MFRATSKPIVFVALAAAALLLSACGGGGPIGGHTGTPSTLSKASAQELAPLMAQSVQAQMGLFQGAFAPIPVSPKGTIQGLAALAAISPQQYEGCMDLRGDTADTDEDGIPFGATYYFNCSINEHGVSLTISGSIRMKDFFPDNGYIIEFNDFSFEMEFEGQRSFFHADGFVKVQLPTSSLKYIATVDLELAFDFDGEAGYVSLVASQAFETYDEADAFSRGTLTYAGELTLTSDGKTYQLGMKSDPSLEVDSSCASGFAGGAAEYRDEEGNTVRVEFSCDSYTTSYNGGPL